MGAGGASGSATYSSVLMSASSLSAVRGLLVAAVVDERSSVAAAAVAVRGTFIVADFCLTQKISPALTKT